MVEKKIITEEPSEPSKTKFLSAKGKPLSISSKKKTAKKAETKKKTKAKAFESTKAKPLSAKDESLSTSTELKKTVKKKAAKKKEAEPKTEDKAEEKVEDNTELKTNSESPKTNSLDAKDKSLSTDDKKQKSKEIIKSLFARERVLTEATDEARNLFNKSAYGKIIEEGKVQLSLPEALYLLEKGKLQISDGKKKSMSAEDFIKKARKAEPNFWIRYCVFKDMRNRGYIIKTALKFGADFRVYDRGIKPGEDHARWIIFPVHEGETLTWYEFAAKNRVAHSTKKRLMMGIVDDEGDVTYYEIKWMRP